LAVRFLDAASIDSWTFPAGAELPEKFTRWSAEAAEAAGPVGERNIFSAPQPVWRAAP
jgi:hypothetical protein